MRNLYIRIIKNLINILLYKDYKASFLFFPSEIFMPVYFSFFLALSLIIFENLVFSFFRCFSCIFSFYLFFSSSFFICSLFPNPLIFQIKNRHSFAVTIFRRSLYVLFYFFSSFRSPDQKGQKIGMIITLATSAMRHIGVPTFA